MEENNQMKKYTFNPKCLHCTKSVSCSELYSLIDPCSMNRRWFWCMRKATWIIYPYAVGPFAEYKCKKHIKDYRILFKKNPPDFSKYDDGPAIMKLTKFLKHWDQSEDTDETQNSDVEVSTNLSTKEEEKEKK